VLGKPLRQIWAQWQGAAHDMVPVQFAWPV
jgi:hypothetical protein